MTSKECEICAREFLPGEKNTKAKTDSFICAKHVKQKNEKKSCIK